ncbi:MAG TPA: RNA methyltransferase [Flavobacteriaceae bacterium]|nr:RNA methyltransferase [Flavobacteriaceae bacterium]
MIKTISSLQNPLIKSIVSLREKSRERKKTGLFVLEGLREFFLAIDGRYEIKHLLICQDLITSPLEKDLLKRIDSDVEITYITSELYRKIAYRGSTEGLLAIVKTKNFTLGNLQFDQPNPLILVAEAPEKPGNIGALLRTADAANLDAVIIANPKTDMYNPNIIRSSVGCLFTNTIATGTTSEILQFLKNSNINIFCAALQASVPYHTADFSKSCALVVGTEDTGLSEEWLEASTQNIIIPMQGQIDSMNVSVAAGILIFEAKRQRNFQ